MEKEYDFRETIIDETLIKQIKEEAENGAQLLELVYLHFFGVDLSSPDLEGGEIIPWHYRISEQLATELMDYSTDTLKDDPEDVAMLWLNYSPSMKNYLPRNQIQIKEVQQDEKRAAEGNR